MRSAATCSRLLLFALRFVAVTSLSAAPQTVVAILTEGRNAAIQTHGTATFIPAAKGAELLNGDVLRTGNQPITLLACDTAADGAIAQERIVKSETTIEIRGGASANLDMQPGKSPLPCAMPLDDRQESGTIYDDRLRKFTNIGWENRFAKLPAPIRSKLIRGLAAPNRVLQNSPANLAALLVRAGELERAGLLADGIAELRGIIALYPDAGWARRWIARLMARTLPSPQPELPQPESTTARSPGARATRGAEGVETRGDESINRGTGIIAPNGRVYALVIGIGQYPPDLGVRPLKYAESDAAAFARFLESGRVGNLAQVVLIPSKDRPASSAEIRRAITELITGHADENNTLIVFIAAHGLYGCVDQTTGKAFRPPCQDYQAEPFLLTTDTSAEAAGVTGIPVREFRQAISDNTYRFGRVLMYVDICHAGAVPFLPFTSAPPADVTNTTLDPHVGAWGLLTATAQNRTNKQKEYAYEADQLQHGIFTYYLLSGLAGDAPQTEDMILFSALKDHVTARVKEITGQVQEPDGHASGEIAAVNNTKAKFEFSRVDIKPPLKITGQRADKRDRLASPLPAPGVPADAPPPTGRSALENSAQQIILAYLQGDQTPQTQGQFERCAELYERALALAPFDSFDEARMLFCRGRALIFQKRYDDAVSLIQRSIRLEPRRGYAYNALGIAYLEQTAQNPRLLDGAIAAFEDAESMEPWWVYPLHNLALAYAQQGNYDLALATYQRALKIAPAYSYLPYNIGLLEQSRGNYDAAEREFQLALRIAALRGKRAGSAGNWTENAPPLNALGTLYLNEGRTRAAESYFSRSLKEDPAYVPALHNKALVKYHRGDKTGAISLWRAALNYDCQYTPARLSLAEALATTGSFGESALHYTQVLRRNPDYGSARRDLALVLVSLRRFEIALDQIRKVRSLEPDRPGIQQEATDIEGLLAGRAPKTASIRRALTRGGQ